jgi:hypothetical protein
LIDRAGSHNGTLERSCAGLASLIGYLNQHSARDNWVTTATPALGFRHPAWAVRLFGSCTSTTSGSPLSSRLQLAMCRPSRTGPGLFQEERRSICIGRSGSPAGTLAEASRAPPPFTGARDIMPTATGGSHVPRSSVAVCSSTSSIVEPQGAHAPRLALPRTSSRLGRRRASHEAEPEMREKRPAALSARYYRPPLLSGHPQPCSSWRRRGDTFRSARSSEASLSTVGASGCPALVALGVTR